MLLVAVLVLGAIGPVAGLVSASNVTLTVSVVTAAGDPVSNAGLTATWDGGSRQATTASNGKAFVDVPAGADVTIAVDHPAYVRNSPYVVTDASQEGVTITVYQKSSANLTVVDQDGPVQGVRVVLRKHGSVVTVASTDATGQIQTGVIEAGDYAVNLFKPGYYKQTIPLAVRGDTTKELQIKQGSVTVQFRVLDANFDPPRGVEGATISGADFTSQSGPDGTRAVSLEVNRQYDIQVSKDGYDTVQQTITVGEQDLQVNLSTRKQPDVQLAVANQRVVVGESVQVTVTDQYDRPLRSATVYLDGTAVGQPDTKGVLRVEIDSAGDHTLYAKADSLQSDELTVTGIAGSGGSSTSAEHTADAGGSADKGSGGISIPGAGQLNLRSTAIGIAIGLVLTGALFLYTRFG